MLKMAKSECIELINAVKEGNLKQVMALVDAGNVSKTVLDHPKFPYCSVIGVAAHYGQYEIAEYLLESFSIPSCQLGYAFFTAVARYTEHKDNKYKNMAELFARYGTNSRLKKGRGLQQVLSSLSEIDPAFYNKLEVINEEIRGGLKNRDDNKKNFYRYVSVGRDLLQDHDPACLLEVLGYFAAAYDIAMKYQISLRKKEQAFLEAAQYLHTKMSLEKSEYAVNAFMPQMASELRGYAFFSDAAKKGSGDAYDFLAMLVQSNELVNKCWAASLLLSLPNVAADTKKSSQNCLKKYGEFVAGYEHLYGLKGKPIYARRAIKAFDALLKAHQKKQGDEFAFACLSKIYACRYAMIITGNAREKQELIESILATYRLLSELDWVHLKTALGERYVTDAVKQLENFQAEMKHNELNVYAEKIYHSFYRRSDKQSLLKALEVFADEPAQNIKEQFNALLVAADLGVNDGELQKVIDRYEKAIQLAIKGGNKEDVSLALNKYIHFIADQLGHDEKYLESVISCYDHVMHWGLHARDKKNVILALEEIRKFQASVYLFSQAEDRINDVLARGSSGLAYLKQGNLALLARENDLSAVYELAQKQAYGAWYHGPNIRRALYLYAKLMLLTQDVQEAAHRFHITVDFVDTMRKNAREFIRLYHVGARSDVTIFHGNYEYQVCDLAAFYDDLVKRTFPNASEDPDRLILLAAKEWKGSGRSYIQKEVCYGAVKALEVTDAWIKQKQSLASVADTGPVASLQMNIEKSISTIRPVDEKKQEQDKLSAQSVSAPEKQAVELTESPKSMEAIIFEQVGVNLYPYQNGTVESQLADVPLPEKKIALEKGENKLYPKLSDIKRVMESSSANISEKLSIAQPVNTNKSTEKSPLRQPVVIEEKEVAQFPDVPKRPLTSQTLFKKGQETRKKQLPGKKVKALEKQQARRAMAL